MSRTRNGATRNTWSRIPIFDNGGLGIAKADRSAREYCWTLRATGRVKAAYTAADFKPFGATMPALRPYGGGRSAASTASFDEAIDGRSPDL